MEPERPTGAWNVIVSAPGKRLDRLYALLQQAFDPSELDSHDWLESAVSRGPQAMYGTLLLGRFEHGESGEEPVGAMVGSVLPLASGGFAAAIAWLAVHERRRGGGHGAALLAALEREAAAWAADRGGPLLACIAEAMPDSRRFWEQQGFAVEIPCWRPPRQWGGSARGQSTAVMSKPRVGAPKAVAAEAFDALCRAWYGRSASALLGRRRPSLVA